MQINSRLAQEGFLTWKIPAAAPADSSDAVNGSHKCSAVRTALSAAQKRGKRGLSPSPYFYADKYLGPLKSWLRASRSRGGIDWSKTQAFSEGKEGDIFVNLKGRDPHGVVEPGAAYEAVRNWIIKRLQRLADPATGERAVERVYTNLSSSF